MIIIEGMDNSGKTTLAKKLSAHFEIPYKHSETPKNAREVMADMTYECLPTSPPVIRDRVSPISEMIYGPVCREGSIMEGSQWSLIDMICRTDNLIIYCRPAAHLIRKCSEREQMEGVVDNADELLARYDWVMNRINKCYPGNVVIWYNYQSEGQFSTLLTNVRRIITRQQVLSSSIKALESGWEKMYLYSEELKK